jgi:hypothetical protein
MGKRKVELHVTFEAVYKVDGEYIPEGEVTALEEMTLVIPNMDTKFVVLPKVLEGVTDRVMAQLDTMVADYYRKQAEEKKRQEAEQLRPSFWGNGTIKESAG